MNKKKIINGRTMNERMNKKWINECKNEWMNEK